MWAARAMVLYHSTIYVPAAGMSTSSLDPSHMGGQTVCRNSNGMGNCFNTALGYHSCHYRSMGRGSRSWCRLSTVSTVVSGMACHTDYGLNMSANVRAAPTDDQVRIRF